MVIEQQNKQQKLVEKIIANKNKKISNVTDQNEIA